jgi:hypothetical protein
MSIYSEEILILKSNKVRFLGLLKRKEFKNNSVEPKEVLVMFDRLEQELLNEKSTKREILILEELPVFYLFLFAS